MTDDPILRRRAAKMQAQADAPVETDEAKAEAPAVQALRADSHEVRRAVKSAARVKAREAAEARADADALRPAPPVKIELGTPGSSNTPLHVLNAQAAAAHAALAADAREVATAAAKGARDALMAPERKLVQRFSRARRGGRTV